MPLWPNAAPNTNCQEPRDVPTLDIYPPLGSAFQNAAVLIFPGGAYAFRAPHEGEGYAGFFQLQGFNTFVLNYRLGADGYRHDAIFADAQRAMRMVRNSASTKKFSPRKIIVIGSSAGGHLAATLLTRWDEGNSEATDPVERESCRPNLGVLCYPVISMGEFAHEGSRIFFLGENPPQELIEQFSNECHVNSQTPPCFVWHTCADDAVPVENTMRFTQALRKAGVPFECHIYQDGGHGLGMLDGQPWTQDCIRWISRRFTQEL